jgi:hypothetical protein
MKSDESSPVTPAPPAASHRVSLSPDVNEQLPNWEELFASHNVTRTSQLANPSAHVMSPRFIRLRDAPRYLGMDKNRFNREVRPALTNLPVGVQGVAFDRLDLDRWADEYKSRNGHLAAQSERKKPWETKRRQVSRNAVGFGISTSSLEASAFGRALQQATSRKP